MELRTSFKMGAFTYFRGGTITKLKRIGSFCAVAPGVRIGDGQHPLSYLSTHPFQWQGWRRMPGESVEYDHFHSETRGPEQAAPSEIGSDVWIGANVIVMGGVNIGDGAVLGAGAIVTKDVRPYEIVAGVPAKHLKFRFDEKTVQRLLAVKWWDYALDSLSGLAFDDVDRCLDELEDRAAHGQLKLRSNRWFRHTKR